MSVQAPTPIELVLQTATLAVSTTLSLAVLVKNAVVTVAHPILWALLLAGRVVLAPVLWLLAPVFFALKVAFEVTIRRPFNIVARIGEELQDVWVFCGIAVLVGALLGLGARGVARILAQAVVGVPPLPSSAPADPPSGKLEDGTLLKGKSGPRPVGTRRDRTRPRVSHGREGRTS